MHIIEIFQFYFLTRQAAFQLLENTDCAPAWTLFMFNWFWVQFCFGCIDSWLGCSVKMILVHLSIYLWRNQIWKYFEDEKEFILQQLQREQIHVLIDLGNWMIQQIMLTYQYFEIKSENYQKQITKISAKKNAGRKNKNNQLVN